MSDKLMKMVVSLKDQFASVARENPPSNLILAEAILENVEISAGAEYFEYVNRYGPPVDGNFDQDLLFIVRRDLGITVTPTTYMGVHTLTSAPNIPEDLVQEIINSS